MTMSLNPVAAGFNSKLQAKLWNTSRPYAGVSTLKTDHVTTSSGGLCFGSRKSIKYKRLGLLLSASNSNQVAPDTADKESSTAEKALTSDQLLAAKPQSLSSLAEDIQLKSSAKDELGTQTIGTSNGSGVPSDVTTSTASASIKAPKRSSLTAREKLRAARVLSRYNTDSKPSKKTQLGSKVLDALRESDRGNKKRSGLPEAPANMLDDSKRGMPKQGLTFDLPGGNDLFLIIFSAVFISTLMFGTTFVVWKVGAIHFND